MNRIAAFLVVALATTQSFGQIVTPGTSVTTTSVRTSFTNGSGISYNSGTGTISLSSSIFPTNITTTSLTIKGMSDGFLKTTSGVVSSTTSPQFTALGIGVAPASASVILGTQAVASSGNMPTVLTLTGGAHTTLSNGGALTVRDAYLNFAQTTSVLTGSINNYWSMNISPRSMAGSGGALTLTSAATLVIDRAPLAGNATTIINDDALLVRGLSVTTGTGAVTTACGATINAPTGATNNYSARLLGGFVGINESAPITALHVTSTTGPQFQFGYDTNTNAFKGSVSSAGAVTFDATGASSAFAFSDAVTVNANFTTTGSATFSGVTGTTGIAQLASGVLSGTTNLTGLTGIVLTGNLTMSGVLSNTGNGVLTGSLTTVGLVNNGNTTLSGTFSNTGNGTISGQAAIGGAINGTAQLASICTSSNNRGLLIQTAASQAIGFIEGRNSSGTLMFYHDTNGGLGVRNDTETTYATLGSAGTARLSVVSTSPHVGITGNTLLTGTLGVTGATTFTGASSIVGEVTFGAGGIAADGAGYKHSRVTTGGIAAMTATAVTVTWGTPFADSNYTVDANVVDSTGTILSLQVDHIIAVTSATCSILVNNRSAGTLTGTLHAIGRHD